MSDVTLDDAESTVKTTRLEWHTDPPEKPLLAIVIADGLNGSCRYEIGRWHPATLPYDEDDPPLYGWKYDGVDVCGDADWIVADVILWAELNELQGAVDH